MMSMYLDMTIYISLLASTGPHNPPCRDLCLTRICSSDCGHSKFAASRAMAYYCTVGTVFLVISLFYHPHGSHTMNKMLRLFKTAHHWVIRVK